MVGKFNDLAQGFNGVGLVVYQQVAAFGKSQSVLLDESARVGVIGQAVGQGRGGGYPIGIKLRIGQEEAPVAS